MHIVKKKKQDGKIFEFVRFVGIDNQVWLENQLKDIWFGSYKMWINMFRFARTKIILSHSINNIFNMQRKLKFKPQVDHISEQTVPRKGLRDFKVEEWKETFMLT